MSALKSFTVSKLCNALFFVDYSPTFKKYPKITEYHFLFNYAYQSRTLSCSETVVLASGITNGVAYLHSHRTDSGSRKVPIAHRDLKSTNILVRKDKTCVISDFGLAIPLNSTEDESKNVSLLSLHLSYERNVHLKY